MAVALTSDQELIQSVVREFARSHVAPAATGMDRSQRFPRDDLGRMAQLGLLGLLVPADRGGAGTDTVSFALAIEEIARAGGTHAAFLIIQNALVGRTLTQLGVQGEPLASTVSGAKWAAVGITEESSGSALQDFLTTAQPAGDGFTITGTKVFVAGAGAADDYFILAQVPGSGPSFFHVPASSTGLHVGPAGSTLGLRALPLGDVYLNRVQVPRSSLLGPAGGALKALEEPLHMARLGAAAALVGLAEAALVMSIDFSQKRVQFGQPIIRFGAIRGTLVDVRTEVDAARAALLDACGLRDAGRDYVAETYEARLLAHRAAVRATRAAHRVHGGAGFMRDLPLERVSRDVRTLMHLWDAQDISRSRLAGHLFP